MADAQHHSIRYLAWRLGVPVEVLRTLAHRAEAEYRPFEVAGRTIDNPTRAIKHVQRQIRRRLLAPLPLADCVHGCVRSRSPLTNARPHCRQRKVASVDIKRFFPSVTPRMVYAVWRDVTGFGPRLASLLTKLTTCRFHLPQGAPSSDALANHVLSGVDQRLLHIASELQLNITRYLDDISISGDLAPEALGPVIDAVRKAGFAVRHKKTRNRRRSEGRTLTGYTIDGPRGPSVPRRWRDKLRARVHRLILARRRGEQTTAEERAVRGSLVYLRQTNAGAADRLERQLQRG